MGNFIRVQLNSKVDIKNKNGKTLVSLSNDDNLIYEGEYILCVLQGTSRIYFVDVDGKVPESSNGDYSSFDAEYYVKKAINYDNEYARKSSGEKAKSKPQERKKSNGKEGFLVKAIKSPFKWLWNCITSPFKELWNEITAPFKMVWKIVSAPFRFVKKIIDFFK